VTNQVSGEVGIKITYPHSKHNIIEIMGGHVPPFSSTNATNSSSNTSVIGTIESNNIALTEDNKFRRHVANALLEPLLLLDQRYRYSHLFTVLYVN
jgi:hypothetical protein